MRCEIPNALNDWLIFLASSRVSPCAPVLPIFSLPAKSAKFNLPNWIINMMKFANWYRFWKIHHRDFESA